MPTGAILLMLGGKGETGVAPVVPTLQSVNAGEWSAVNCEQLAGWTNRITWSIQNPDNVRYRIDIGVSFSPPEPNLDAYTELVTNLPGETGGYNDETGVQGNPLASDTQVYRRYLVRLVRREDGVTVQYSETPTSTTEYGDCI